MRAQFWSFDIIFAIVIFSVALTLLTYTWYNINSQLSLAYGNGATVMQIEQQSLASTLLTPGSPSYWNSEINTSNASTWTGISVGLANNPDSGILSPAKVYALMAMASTTTGYQQTKQVLGIGYDYYIVIKGGSLNITIGENPNTNGALTTYTSTSRAFLGGVPVAVQVDVWTSQSFGVG